MAVGPLSNTHTRTLTVASVNTCINRTIHSPLFIYYYLFYRLSFKRQKLEWISKNAYRRAVVGNAFQAIHDWMVCVTGKRQVVNEREIETEGRFCGKIDIFVELTYGFVNAIESFHRLMCVRLNRPLHR